MTRTIKTISLALLFALGILFGFIGGFVISNKESHSNLHSCATIKDGEQKSNNDCHKKR